MSRNAEQLWKEQRTSACSHRAPDDDFFCLRYQVWYCSFDCAWRTKFRTSPGCDECDQGRFNLKRHRAHLPRHDPLTRFIQ